MELILFGIYTLIFLRLLDPKEELNPITRLLLVVSYILIIIFS
jgi:hypothetical protein